MLEILKDGDRRLHSPSKSVGRRITKAQQSSISRVKKLLGNMTEAVAIAATQVGMDIRFFVARRSPTSMMVVIDPKVTWTSIDDSEDLLVNPDGSPFARQLPQWEECLSFPGKEFLVTRPSIIKVEFMNEKGKMKSMTLQGLDARVFLHEVDHLDGVTIDQRCQASRDVEEDEKGMTM